MSYNRQLFIEYRFQSDIKRMLRETMYEVAHKFGVKGAITHRAVPHLALYYGEGNADAKRVAAIVATTSARFTIVPFTVDKYEWREGTDGKVIAVHIIPSSELSELRKRLSSNLSKIYTPSKFDLQTNFWFHSTIAFKDIDGKFNHIWNYIQRKESINLRQYLTRITILNEKREIEYEYDLILKRLLGRNEALSRYFYNKTISRLKQLANIQ